MVKLQPFHQLFFLFLVVAFHLIGISSSSTILNCKKTHTFRSIELQNAIQCVECQNNFVLDYVLEKCINSNDLNLPYCKRQSRTGSCEEAECTLQVRSDGAIVSRLNGNAMENCAIFDKNTKNCIRPRFGFNLNFETQEIKRDLVHMCAVRKGGVCIDYFSQFIPFSLPSSTSPYSVYAFGKLDQLDNVSSSVQTGLKCLGDYQIKKDLLNYLCSLSYKISHCKTYSSSQCSECQLGYYLNGNQCLNSISNCTTYKYQNQKVVCSKCVINYFFQDGNCIEIQNCRTFIHPIIGNCLSCMFPYYGDYCQNISNLNEPKCLELNANEICTLCIDSQNQFFHIYERTCQDRQFSNNCRFPRGYSDSCEDFTCQNGYYFDTTTIEKDFHFQSSSKYDEIQLLLESYYYFQNKSSIFSWLPHTTDQKEPLQLYIDVYYEKHYQNPNKYSQLTEFCIPRTQDIPYCLLYDNIYESCSLCYSGSLVQRNDMFLNYYYRFICEESSQPKVIDPILNCILQFQTHCLLCDQDYFLIDNQCFYSPYCSGDISSNGLCYDCQQDFDPIITLVETSDGLNAQCVKNYENNNCIHTIDNICVECSDTFVMIKETKRCVPETQVLELCKVATFDFNCIECIQDYGLVNQKCVKVGGSCILRQNCDSNYCTICDSNPSIICSNSCNTGYKLSVSGICMYECLNGDLVGKKEDCTPQMSCVAQNCSLCDQIQPNICMTCQQTFYLSQGKCIKNCPDGTYFNSDKQSCDMTTKIQTDKEQSDSLQTIIIVVVVCGGVITLLIFGIIKLKSCLKKRKIICPNPSLSSETKGGNGINFNVELQDQNEVFDIQKVEVKIEPLFNSIFHTIEYTQKSELKRGKMVCPNPSLPSETKGGNEINFNVELQDQNEVLDIQQVEVKIEPKLSSRVPTIEYTQKSELKRGKIICPNPSLPSETKGVNGVNFNVELQDQNEVLNIQKAEIKIESKLSSRMQTIEQKQKIEQLNDNISIEEYYL